MKEAFQKLTDLVGSVPAAGWRGLGIGILAGILLMLIVQLIWWLCRGKRRCRSIELNSDKGTVSVSADAVSNVLTKAAASLKVLSVNRIAIYRRKDGYEIAVRAGMDMGGGIAAPRLIGVLSNLVKVQMMAVFGVENISAVTLKIDSCRGTAAAVPVNRELTLEPPAAPAPSVPESER